MSEQQDTPPTAQSDALLQALFRSAALTSRQSITPKATDAPVPLTTSQQQMWFLHQLAPDLPIYNSFRAFHLGGTVDIPTLEDSLKEIITRHDILRTLFKIVDGVPSQFIQPQPDYEFSLVGLTGNGKKNFSPEAVPHDFLELMASETRRTFHLTKGPCLRIKLYKLAAETHFLVLVMPHIISDGWSFSVFFRELFSLYNAFSAQQSSPLKELPIQFSDYSFWQQDWLAGNSLNSHFIYWQEQLAECSTNLDLPIDYPRPANRSFQGACESFHLSGSMPKALKTLSRQEDATLFMLLLASFQVLLFRYCGQDDIVVGSPTANRNHRETQGLIGCFINTLVLRTNMSGNPNFRQLLTRVKKMSLDAFAHQDLPFQKLVEKLQLNRDLTFSPLFQVAFVLQNTTPLPLQFPDLTLTPVTLDNKTAKYDLTLVMEETTTGLMGKFEYSTDLFKKDSIQRLIGHFQTLLKSIANEPDAPISDLPMLSRAERHQLLVEWNDTGTDYPRNSCIHELFEQQVELNSKAVAVVFDNISLTYEKLNQRANQLAHFLMSHNVSPGSFVGIYMERSVEMIVGLLAVLKVGGVYIPLDLEYPRERLDFMQEDADISVLITQPAFAAKLSAKEVITINSDWQSNEFAHQSTTNPIYAGKADSLAYVIYTSGSTGVPKGVCVSHRAVNRLVLRTNYVEIKEDDVVAQASNSSFDAATFEIWGALLNGAKLVGVNKETLLSSDLLTRQIHTHRISTLFLTTSLFNQLAREAPGMFKPLRHLVFGGEAATLKWARAVLKAGGPERLVNGYGPTECTTFATWHLLQLDVDETTTIPIGKPISNTEVYILDDQQQPVPPGIPGELYLAGDGLADGYLNRSDLTAEKFIPNPFSDQPASLMYKTGDRGRYLANGDIIFQDRIDQQVKIRGFRIELGEIEAVLFKHPVVSEAIVTAHHGESERKQLVAYVIARKGAELSKVELQVYLKEKLPGYMIPSFFVFLDQLPMTPNGKVDKGLLPPPTVDTKRTEEGYEAPCNKMEIQLVKIWEKVLGMHSIGVQDDFFDLGGHSLLAMEVLDRIEKVFNKTLPVATLFQHSTIKTLGEILEKDGWSVPWELIIPIRPTGNKPPFFAIHGNMAKLASHLENEQPVFSIMPHGMTGLKSPIDIGTMSQEYAQQIKAIQPQGPYSLGGYSIGGILAIEVARLFMNEGQEISSLILIDPTNPRDNKSEPGDNAEKSCSQPQPSSYGSNHVKRAYNNFFSKQGISEKLTYLLKGLLGNIEKMYGINTRAKQTACELYLRSGNRIPMKLRRFYHSQSSLKALKTYKQEVYIGNVSIIHSQDRSTDFQLKWEKLINGNVDFHALPADHFSILVEPIVKSLANEISSRLPKYS